jgi:hypothetical protein
MIEFRYDHVRLRSPDPDATAAWYAKTCDAEVIRSMMSNGIEPPICGWPGSTTSSPRMSQTPNWRKSPGVGQPRAPVCLPTSRPLSLRNSGAHLVCRVFPRPRAIADLSPRVAILAPRARRAGEPSNSNRFGQRRVEHTDRFGRLSWVDFCRSRFGCLALPMRRERSLAA